MPRSTPSIYSQPDIKVRLLMQRALLRRRNIPVFPIGRAYIPGNVQTPADQAWVRLVLR